MNNTHIDPQRVFNGIKGDTALYGVIGNPIEHSFSPQIHNSLYRNLGVNAVYTAFRVEKHNFLEAVKGIRALGLKGINVTIPFKEEIMEHLDYVHEDAFLIGAVNTIVNEDGILKGYNTDGMGFIKSLKNRGIEYRGKCVTIIGAGGTARAVAISLALNGVSKIFMINRTHSKALQLCDYINESVGKHICTAYAEISHIEDCSILINSTPIGMWPGTDCMPVDRGFCFKSVKTVYDIIYNPVQTKLLRMAADNNCITINGWDMLVWQAMESEKIWLNRDIDEVFVKSLLKMEF